MCSIAYVNFLFFKIFIKVPTYIFLKIEQCHGVKVKNKDRLMITPHIAWASVEARKKLIELSAKNIEDFIKG